MLTRVSSNRRSLTPTQSQRGLTEARPSNALASSSQRTSPQRQRKCSPTKNFPATGNHSSNDKSLFQGNMEDRHAPTRKESYRRSASSSLRLHAPVPSESEGFQLSTSDLMNAAIAPLQPLHLHDESSRHTSRHEKQTIGSGHLHSLGFGNASVPNLKFNDSISRRSHRNSKKNHTLIGGNASSDRSISHSSSTDDCPVLTTRKSSPRARETKLSIDSSLSGLGHASAPSLMNFSLDDDSASESKSSIRELEATDPAETIELLNLIEAGYPIDILSARDHALLKRWEDIKATRTESSNTEDGLPSLLSS